MSHLRVYFGSRRTRFDVEAFLARSCRRGILGAVYSYYGRERGAAITLVDQPRMIVGQILNLFMVHSVCVYMYTFVAKRTNEREARA